MAEVNASFQELTHREVGKRHDHSPVDPPRTREHRPCGPAPPDGLLSHCRGQSHAPRVDEPGLYRSTSGMQGTPILGRRPVSENKPVCAFARGANIDPALTAAKAGTKRYSASTATTPGTALIAPAICGETLKRPGSFTSTSGRLAAAVSTSADLAVALRLCRPAGQPQDAWRRASSGALVAQGRRAVLSATWPPPGRAARPTGCGRAPLALHFGGRATAARPLPGSSRSRYCGQALREDHGLEMPGRVGQPDDAHLVAGSVRRSCARPRWRPPGPRSRPACTARAEFRPGLDPQRFSTAA